MSNQYHAGQKYTREQKEQLDAAFSAWIDAESYAENAPDGIYSDEGRNLAALILSNAYDTLRAGFDAANKPQAETPAATVERLRCEMRQARAEERLELQREYDGRELVDQEPPFDGWAA